MVSEVRTRFAPSPTGALHLGNVRTAVFNWLFARHHDGRFLLRIEDTDPERTREGSEEGILRDLRWLGLQWDEGPDRGGPKGPYRQSERFELHRDAARRLVDDGRAYPCYCTPEELASDRVEVGGGREVTRYSGRCRELGAEERRRFEEEGRTPAIRFRADPDDAVEVRDEIRGPISVAPEEIDDFVIVRSDGRPTYNFAVVVDDALMEVSHVIRGAGHLSNTPKQALLFDALDRPRPRFVHLPTVLSPEGGKLSKRKGAVPVARLRDRGYHPDAIVNYLSLLGWSDPDEREDLTREELVGRISLERLGASDTAYDPDKLLWLSSRHIQRMDADELADAVLERLDRDRFPLGRREIERAVAVLRDRLSTFAEVNEHLELFDPPPERLDEVRRELGDDPAALRLLDELAGRLRALEDWEPEAITDAIRASGDACDVGGRELYHPIRKAVTGATSGPELGGVIWAVGRRETLERLTGVTRDAPV